MPKLIYITKKYLSYQPFPLALLRPEEAKRYPKKLIGKSLDIGCGDGFFAKNVFGKQGIDFGIDINQSTLNKAKQNGSHRQLFQFDGIRLPFRSQSIRIVIANCVLEHVDHPQKLLNEIGRVTALGGMFYFSVPTTHFISLLLGYRIFSALGLSSLASRYGSFMSWVTRQKYYWPKSIWFRQLQRAGFSVIHQKEFFGRRALAIFDLSHWLSVPSIITKLLIDRWTAFPKSVFKFHLLKKIRDWSLAGPQTPGAFQFFACRKTV